jgi:hypothetical protein
MKTFCVFTVVFLFLGICSVAAQDIIILKDGNTIAAKVSEISTTEIRYKRFDNLDGPTIVIPADKVLSIRYQNGTQEIINADTKTGQKNKPVDTTPPLDPDKFIFAMNVNPGGIFNLVPAPSFCFEFGKGHFNSEVHLIFPILGGFGGLATFNYFWPNRVGGFYLGGGIGYIVATVGEYYSEPYEVSYGEYKRTEYREYYYYTTTGIFTAGLNIGWKFVTRPGIYFRTGAYLGISNLIIYFKPDLAIGYCFK